MPELRQEAESLKTHEEMTQQEMKEKFDMLYNYMAVSNNTKYMMLFGSTMEDMMYFLIDNHKDVAEGYIDKLCSIKWHNYLTAKEAEKIVSSMIPKAPWPKDVWKNAMNQFSLPTEEEPYYNSCALWVTMNMVYSDSANSIASIIGSPLNEIPTEQIVNAVYLLSIDKLKDADHVFDIRRYFNI